MLRMLDLRVFDGPSIYSHKPAARLKLKLEEYIDTPSTELRGLYDYLTSHFPGLKYHCCSKGYEGGFLERLKEGTYLAHIIEHLCLEIQTVLGYEVRYGKTRRAEDDCYDIVFAYKNRMIVKPCVDFILNFITSFLESREFNFEGGMNELRAANSIKLPPAVKSYASPIISITGTSGRTETVRLIKSTLCSKGYRDGADAAVLELDRSRILDEGLPYYKADITVITNIEPDNPGSKVPDDSVCTILSVDELLHIKSLVVEAVYDDGVSILNGDDACTPELMHRARGRIVLFTANENAPLIKKHMNMGGEVVCLDRGNIVHVKDGLRQIINDTGSVGFMAAGEAAALHCAIASAAVCHAFFEKSRIVRSHFFQKAGAIMTSRV